MCFGAVGGGWQRPSQEPWSLAASTRAAKPLCSVYAQKVPWNASSHSRPKEHRPLWLPEAPHLCSPWPLPGHLAQGSRGPRTPRGAAVMGGQNQLLPRGGLGLTTAPRSLSLPPGAWWHRPWQGCVLGAAVRAAPGQRCPTMCGHLHSGTGHGIEPSASLGPPLNPEAGHQAGTAGHGCPLTQPCTPTSPLSALHPLPSAFPSLGLRGQGQAFEGCFSCKGK